jgi:hypothetical protein
VPAHSSLDIHLQRMHRAAQEHPQGHLLWGLRLRWWCLVNQAFPQDASHRYTVLGYSTLKSLTKIWHSGSVEPSTPPIIRQALQAFPQDVLEWLRSSLLGDEASRRPLIDWRSTLLDRNWDCYVQDLASQAFLGAALQVTSQIQHPRDAYSRELIDDLLEGESIDRDEVMWATDDLTADRDPLMCDYEYWAAYAVSIRTDGPERSHDIEERRAFWLNWIKVHLPRSIGSPEELLAALSD